ncbi:Arylsulfatase B [Armadillidium vulgare]|nr:Arylsulfatase B [Armadillidium vulgare]
MTLSNIIITFLICSLVSSIEEANSETSKSTKRPPCHNYFSRRFVLPVIKLVHVLHVLILVLLCVAVVIVTGWNDVGFHGNVEISTPNIDALAYSGVILNNYYVQPLCTPSRGALLSGMYPVHTGLQHHVIRGPEPRGLPLKFTLLPEYLKSMGYTTRIVGKWHLGMFRKEYTPTFRGFDSHYGYWTGRLDYYNHRLVYNHTLGGYDFRKNMDVEYAGVGKYATDLFTEEGVKIINEHNPSVPLFLYLPHLATHVGNDDDPLQAPVEAVQRFSHIKDEKRRIFAAMLWKLDESIGKVVEALKDNDMLKDSIIIFSTDNGGSAGGLENSAGSNWPLKG